MGAITEKQMAAAEKQFKKFESMIQSMTKEERANPDLLATSPSRRCVVVKFGMIICFTIWGHTLGQNLGFYSLGSAHLFLSMGSGGVLRGAVGEQRWM